jgi:tripeptidyl-peptidase-1
MPTIQLEGMRPIPNLLPKEMSKLDIPGLTGLANCGTIVTIECLRALYQFGQGNTSAASNVMGIGEWADFLYLPDLPIFFKNFTTQPIPADTAPTFISIDGGQTANYSYDAAEGSGVESALDFQTAYSIIYPQQLRLYQVGDGVNVDSVGTFNIFLDALDASYCTYLGGDAPYVDPAYPDPNEGGYTGPLQCGGAPKSNVFSFSYNQIEAALSPSYQTRQCHEWMKMGLQGVSVFFASGDSGVANRYNAGYPNSCLTSPDVGPYVDANGTRFSPSFPTNCPWITTGELPCLSLHAPFLNSKILTRENQVGATQIGDGTANATVSDGEQAASFSGGGFSNVFTLPSYQSTAVSTYLKNYPPHYPSHIYNNSGNARAYPDVSSIGTNIPIVFLGDSFSGGGTSASTPIWAGIVTLLNEARIAKGKGPIGFINPTLYKNPQALNDITVGSNPGCGSPGFKAGVGWDPVTGLGSPNYPKLLEVFLSLP